MHDEGGEWKSSSGSSSKQDTYMTLGHLGAKRFGDVVFNLGAGLVGEVAGGRVGDELKLCPDDEVDDARVEAVGPVVVEDLVVGGVLEGGGAAGADGRRPGPAQALGEDEGGDGAVTPGRLVDKLLVAAQLRGHALEALEAVGGDDARDLGPRADLVGRVGRGHAAQVLGVEAAQEVGALGGALALGDVDVPEGDDFEGAHVASQ